MGVAGSGVQFLFFSHGSGRRRVGAFSAVLAFDIPKLPSQSSDDPVTCNPMVTHDNRRCQSYQLGPVHGLKPGQEHHSSEIYNSPSQLMSWNAPCVGKRDDAGARARCVGEEGKRARVPG